MPDVKCFLLEQVPFMRESLRRYMGSGIVKCTTSGLGYHNASVVICEAVKVSDDAVGTGSPDFDHGDPRWPTHCSCGYEFEDEDYWQHQVERLYGGAPDDKLYTLQESPPGSMWVADWYGDRCTRPDGDTIVVKLPSGEEWLVDGPSYDKDGKIYHQRGWTRTGELPLITVRPSIHTRHYHGFLTNGVLKAC